MIFALLRSNFTIFILRSIFHMRLFGLIFLYLTTNWLFKTSLAISVFFYSHLKIITFSLYPVFRYSLPYYVFNFNSTA
ncbi:hypothetical protein CW304_25430 [Bacillus sp. UFRGS-B20]|nr:hypothetical protein CW304_25430 [Bacillus sp. UFRGS-B20]